MTTLHEAPASSIGGAKVAIFTDGAPVDIVPLHEFLDPRHNEFDPEELEDLFRGFANGWMHKLGGGAAPLTIVKLYGPGDEDLTFAEITCPDFDRHSEHGCRTCGKPALNHHEGGEP